MGLFGPLKPLQRAEEDGKALAKTLWRPFVPIGPPDPVLGLVLGEVAQVVTRGQKVLPVRALRRPRTLVSRCLRLSGCDHVRRCVAPARHRR